MVSGEPPLTQHRQDQGAGGGFQETEQRTHTHITNDKTPVERVNSFKFLGIHITEDLSDDLLTQMQCWIRHINASSSWDGWGSLECVRKARRIIKESSHPSHSLLSLLPSGRRLRIIRSRTSRLRDSFFPSGYQANERQKLIHPTAHSQFTLCHALHFNLDSNTVQLDYTHTLH